MMTEKNDDAARAREDSFLGELIPQVTEHLAAQHSGAFDAEAGRARFVTWLAAHTKEPAAPARGRAGGGTRVISNNAEKVPGRPWRWRLPGTWLALGGILAGVSAAVAWIAAVGSSSTVLIFLVGALTGVLAGGTVCVRYLRSAIADDIDPQLRRMQIQLDNIESAVNLALASRYAELSQLPWPPAISSHRPPGQSER